MNALKIYSHAFFQLQVSCHGSESLTSPFVQPPKYYTACYLRAVQTTSIWVASKKTSHHIFLEPQKYANRQQHNLSYILRSGLTCRRSEKYIFGILEHPQSGSHNLPNFKITLRKSSFQPNSKSFYDFRFCSLDCLSILNQ